MLPLYLCCVLIPLTNALSWKEAKFDRRNDIRSLHDVYRIKEREGYNAKEEQEKKKKFSNPKNQDLRRMQEVLQRVNANLEEKQIENLSLKLQPVPENKRKLLRERKRHLELENIQRQTPRTNKDRKSEKYYLEHPKEISADNPLENVVEAMQIETNGHYHQADGAKPRQKAKLIGDNLDEDIIVEKPEGIKRNFLLDPERIWPKGIIPYEIASNTYTVDGKTAIYEAIKQFNDLTCVRWVQRDDPLASFDNLGHTDYVRIQRESGFTGCKSYVGKQSSGSYQRLTLTPGGCMSRPTIVHEMLHAMGAQHEQSRPDRDSYLNVQWQHIKRKKRHNFELRNVNTDVPYDVSSDLQYSVYAFSIDGRKTMPFIDYRLEFLPKIADGLMFYDVQEVDSAYGCSAQCTDLGCQNAGFMNWECRCYCPDLLEGDTCELPVSIGSCGGVVNVGAEDEIYVNSPNYPNNYNTGLKCTWLIQGVANNILRGTIEDMDINNNGHVCFHWLEFRYNLLGQTGPKRCGITNNEVWDASPDEFKNKMIIQFDSHIDEPTSKGFRMMFKSIGTGCIHYPCRFGSCDSPLNTDTYTCTCKEGFTGTNCDVLTDSASIGCSAEIGEYCMLAQDTNADFDWVTKTGATKTESSGPGNAVEGFIYWYTEASSPRIAGEKAVMFTNISLPSIKRCLYFSYHMYGSEMGTLNVYFEDEQGTRTTVFTKTGNQGNQWHTESMTSQATDGLKVIFEAVMGSGSKSDMALDDVWLRPWTVCGCRDDENPCAFGTCNSDFNSMTYTCSCDQGFTGPNCDVLTEYGTIGCNGEANEYCVLEQETQTDDFDWIFTSEGTPTSSTGPEAAKVGTVFMFIESSSPRQDDDKAIMVTKMSLPRVDRCLRFWYHMYGSTMGILNVYTENAQGTRIQIFTMSGDQGNQWNESAIFIPAMDDLKVIFEGIRGSSSKSDIALDDIKLIPGTCGSNVDHCVQSPCSNGGQCSNNYNDNTFTCTCTSGWVGDTCQLKDVTTGTTFTCGFTPGENECVFTNTPTGDDFDWTFTNVATSSSSTGPDTAYSREYFAFTEASSPRQPNDVATLTTSTFKLPDSPLCMQYHFHMYSEPGSLVIKAGERGTTDNQIEIWTGNQGEQWHRSIVQIPQLSDAVISIRGIRGPTSKGDIGLDLITLQKGLCSSPCGSFPCQNAGICSNNQDGTYQCSCKTGFAGSECQLIDNRLETSIACDFEDNEVGCIFENDLSYDDFDWRRRSDRTSSSGTGPKNGAASGSYYMYTEASSPRVEGDFAVLETQNYRLKDSAYCLTLSINMRGQPGQLVISAKERTGNWRFKVSYLGHQGDNWFIAKIDIPQISDPVIAVTGFIGSTSKGDIAVDNLVLTEEQC
ncbi:MAM and LDL-receptor class A domain-containing protein 1-like [Mytilus californianus]|uniref:MAM and LDL-receptor class A domain-containing protein 1-like n=1 Tax=Mytilus californianus TaxID=6549 RepID=UPI002247DA73|nr:MAM and LDL-receptor class A domain-containing protein 1-like [Mytilus californianus]